MKSSNRLHEGMNNQILYKSSFPLASRQKFEEILRTLYIKDLHDVVHRLPTNTCYSSAVFGAKNNLHRNRDAVDHVISRLKISSPATCDDIYSSIVFIERTNRRIINIADLEQSARAAGFKSVKIVKFENMSVKDQITLAANTRVMVGVQGAGLQWAIFMPSGSVLIEISWPQKYWFKYFKFVTSYDIQFINVTANDVRVNWRTFEQKVKHGGKCSDEEKLKLLRMTHTNMWDAENIWKHADVVVDVDRFTQVIKQLKIE